MSNSSPQPIVIGVDPGQNGGIAVFSSGGELLEVYHMPLDVEDEIDSLELYTLFNSYDPLLVVVEKVGSNPAWGKASIWKFARNLEAIISTLKISEIPYDCKVLPTTWKKVVLAGTDRDKQAAIAHVHSRYPAFTSKVKKHDGLADAVCIGEYGVRELVRGRQKDV